jgi:hypothetical protein
VLLSAKSPRNSQFRLRADTRVRQACHLQQWRVAERAQVTLVDRAADEPRALRPSESAVHRIDRADLRPRGLHQLFLIVLNYPRSQACGNPVGGRQVQLSEPVAVPVALHPGLSCMETRVDFGPHQGPLTFRQRPRLTGKLIGAVEQSAQQFGLAPRTGRPGCGLRGRRGQLGWVGAVELRLLRADQWAADSLKSALVGRAEVGKPAARLRHVRDPASDLPRGGQSMQLLGERREIAAGRGRAETPREIDRQADPVIGIAAAGVAVPGVSERPGDRVAEAGFDTRVVGGNNACQILAVGDKPARADQPGKVDRGVPPTE